MSQRGIGNQARGPTDLGHDSSKGSLRSACSRGGLTSKIHAAVDADGLPVGLGLTPGEAHDNRLCSVLLTRLHQGTMLLADRGYDADWIRDFASQRGAWTNIPPKRNRKKPICFSPRCGQIDFVRSQRALHP